MSIMHAKYVQYESTNHIRHVCSMRAQFVLHAWCTCAR